MLFISRSTTVFSWRLKIFLHLENWLQGWIPRDPFHWYCVVTLKNIKLCHIDAWADALESFGNCTFLCSQCFLNLSWKIPALKVFAYSCSLWPLPSQGSASNATHFISYPTLAVCYASALHKHIHTYINAYLHTYIYIHTGVHSYIFYHLHTSIYTCIKILIRTNTHT